MARRPHRRPPCRSCRCRCSPASASSASMASRWPPSHSRIFCSLRGLASRLMLMPRNPHSGGPKARRLRRSQAMRRRQTGRGAIPPPGGSPRGAAQCSAQRSRQRDGLAHLGEEFLFGVVVLPAAALVQLDEMRPPALGEHAPLERDIVHRGTDIADRSSLNRRLAARAALELTLTRNANTTGGPADGRHALMSLGLKRSKETRDRRPRYGPTC